MREILTSAQLASRLEVDVKTIRVWTQTGRIPALRLSVRTIRYDLDEVLSAIKAEPAGRLTARAGA